MAGIPPKKLVEAHGTFATAHCQVCHKSYLLEDLEEAIFSGQVPKCKMKTCQVRGSVSLTDRKFQPKGSGLMTSAILHDHNFMDTVQGIMKSE